MQQWLTDSLGLCEILNQIMAVPALLIDAAECYLNPNGPFHTKGNRFLMNVEQMSYFGSFSECIIIEEKNPPYFKT